MSFWIYKCNSKRAEYQNAYGDWEEVFSGPGEQSWGSTEYMRNLVELRDRIKPGDIIIAMQTNRNELVGLANVVGFKKRNGFDELFLEPLTRIGEKVLPLKKRNPAVARIPALQGGPIRSIYEITDKDAKVLLVEAGVSVPTSGPKATKKGNGAGFGSPLDNKKVELAAMRNVMVHYKAKGWSVFDCSTENRGYDLECKKGSKAVHCEVKGVSGSCVAFPITKNERSTWSTDQDFVLAVVTNALSKPQLHLYEGPTCIQDFAFNPIQYMAVLR